MYYNKKYDIGILERSNPKYKELEDIDDYEYSNTIAYKMLLLTKSFNELFDVKVEDRREEWYQKAKDLGLDTYVLKEEYKKLNNNSLLTEDFYSFTLDDVGENLEGLSRLITYYYNKNKIYVINEDKNILNKPFSEELSLEEIKNAPDQYSIPCKDLYSLLDGIVMNPIDKNLCLKVLEDEFLSTLTLYDLIGFNGVITKYWNKRASIENLDVDDGLSRVVNYYVKNKQIYRLKKSNKEEYEKVDTSDNIGILLNHSDFHIPCKVVEDDKLKTIFKPINLQVSLDEIDETDKKYEDKFSAKVRLSEIDYFGNDFTSGLTIGDIKNGFSRLIQYYLEKQRLYPNELIKDTKIKFKRYDHKRLKDDKLSPFQRILISPSNYYIPCKKSIDTFIKTIELKQINKNLPLKKLEDSFLNTLEAFDLNSKEIQIFPSFTYPELKFEESTIINLPINIKLPREEKEAYLMQMLDDYDSKNTNLEHPLETIGIELINASSPKSLEELNTKNKKKNIADIFYIYDLQDAFLKKKEGIRIKKDKEIQKVRDFYEKDSQDEIIEDIEADYKRKIEKFLEDNIFNAIKEITGFSKNKITLANTYINHYIKEEKYKELITAVNTLKEY